MGRPNDGCFYKNPYPGDSRFEPSKAHDALFDLPPINIEKLSGKLRAPSIPKLVSNSPRKELFPPTDPNLPDSHIYHT